MRYCKVFVGLMWTKVLIVPELRCMSKSKKVMLVVKWLPVNLTGYLELRVWWNTERESGLWVNTMKMSVNWNQAKGF